SSAGCFAYFTVLVYTLVCPLASMLINGGKSTPCCRAKRVPSESGFVSSARATRPILSHSCRVFSIPSAWSHFLHAQPLAGRFLTMVIVIGHLITWKRGTKSGVPSEACRVSLPFSTAATQGLP